MGFHLIAGEENYFLNLFAKIENSKPVDIKLANDTFQDKPTPDILRIEGDTAFISIIGPLSPKGPSTTIFLRLTQNFFFLLKYIIWQFFQ